MNKIISIFGVFVLFSVLGLSFCKGDRPDDKPPDNMPPDNIPAGDISELRVSRQDTTTLRLTWMNPAANSMRSRVAFREGSTPPENCSSYLVETRNESYDHTITLPGTPGDFHFSYRVCAVDTNDQLSSGVTVTFTISVTGSAANEVVGVKLTSPSRGMLQLSWSRPPGEYTGARIAFGETSDPSDCNSPIETLDAGTTTYNHTNLSELPGGTYRFRVCSLDDEGIPTGGVVQRGTLGPFSASSVRPPIILDQTSPTQGSRYTAADTITLDYMVPAESRSVRGLRLIIQEGQPAAINGTTICTATGSNRFSQDVDVRNLIGSGRRSASFTVPNNRDYTALACYARDYPIMNGTNGIELHPGRTLIEGSSISIPVLNYPSSLSAVWIPRSHGGMLKWTTPPAELGSRLLIAIAIRTSAFPNETSSMTDRACAPLLASGASSFVAAIYNNSTAGLMRYTASDTTYVGLNIPISTTTYELVGLNSGTTYQIAICTMQGSAENPQIASSFVSSTQGNDTPVRVRELITTNMPVLDYSSSVTWIPKFGGGTLSWVNPPALSGRRILMAVAYRTSAFPNEMSSMTDRACAPLLASGASSFVSAVYNNNTAGLMPYTASDTTYVGVNLPSDTNSYELAGLNSETTYRIAICTMRGTREFPQIASSFVSSTEGNATQVRVRELITTSVPVLDYSSSVTWTSSSDGGTLAWMTPPAALGSRLLIAIAIRTSAFPNQMSSMTDRACTPLLESGASSFVGAIYGNNTESLMPYTASDTTYIGLNVESSTISYSLTGLDAETTYRIAICTMRGSAENPEIASSFVSSTQGNATPVRVRELATGTAMIPVLDYSSSVTWIPKSDGGTIVWAHSPAGFGSRILMAVAIRTSAFPNEMDSMTDRACAPLLASGASSFVSAIYGNNTGDLMPYTASDTTYVGVNISSEGVLYELTGLKPETTYQIAICTMQGSAENPQIASSFVSSTRGNATPVRVRELITINIPVLDYSSSTWTAKFDGGTLRWVALPSELGIRLRMAIAYRTSAFPNEMDSMTDRACAPLLGSGASSFVTAIYDNNTAGLMRYTASDTTYVGLNVARDTTSYELTGLSSGTTYQVAICTMWGSVGNLQIASSFVNSMEGSAVQVRVRQLVPTTNELVLLWQGSDQSDGDFLASSGNVCSAVPTLPEGSPSFINPTFFGSVSGTNGNFSALAARLGVSDAATAEVRTWNGTAIGSSTLKLSGLIALNSSGFFTKGTAIRNLLTTASGLVRNSSLFFWHQSNNDGTYHATDHCSNSTSMSNTQMGRVGLIESTFRSYGFSTASRDLMGLGITVPNAVTCNSNTNTVTTPLPIRVYCVAKSM